MNIEGSCSPPPEGASQSLAPASGAETGNQVREGKAARFFWGYRDYRRWISPSENCPNAYCDQSMRWDEHHGWAINEMRWASWTSNQGTKQWIGHRHRQIHCQDEEMAVRHWEALCNEHVLTYHLPSSSDKFPYDPQRSESASPLIAEMMSHSEEQSTSMTPASLGQRMGLIIQSKWYCLMDK
jgi:hypothetical protein